MKVYGEEFTSDQEERIDEVENAVYDLCCILTESYNNELEWNMNYIGEIADMAVEILMERGHRVRYPFHTQDEEGRDIVCDYMDEVRNGRDI